jgi:hypothetical protein
MDAPRLAPREHWGLAQVSVQETTPRMTLAEGLDRLKRQHDLGMRSLENLRRVLAGEIDQPAFQQEASAITSELEALRHG